MLPQKMILFSCNANNSDFLRYYPTETGHLSLLTTRSCIEVGHLDAVAWDKKKIGPSQNMSTVGIEPTSPRYSV
jgi:hypothetical protein